MTRVMAFGQEIGERDVFQNRGMGALKALYQDAHLHQCWWHHHVSEPDRGEEHFAEGANIDHSLRAVQALQRLDRTAIKTILTVEIVFDDPGPGLAGPLQ